MEIKIKNRDWVKNAAIVFLAILLILTFFSNTFMNRSLAEVATAAVQDGSIVAKVRGTGTVTANGSHDVKATQTREIRSVMVKVGQEVQTGDTLFVLGSGDSEELEAAKETLKELQYSYQKQAVNMPTFSNSSQTALNEAAQALDDANNALSVAKTAYNNKKAELEADPVRKTNLQKLSEAEVDKNNASDNLTSIQENYNAKYNELYQEVVKWQNKVNELSTPVESNTPAAASDPPAEGGGSAGTIASTGKTGRYINLASTDGITLAEAQTNLANAQAALTAFKNEEQPKVDAAQQEYETAKAKYDALVSATDLSGQLKAYSDDVATAQANVNLAQSAYNSAYDSYNYTITSNQQSLASASIDLQQLADKIKTQQEKVKQLSGESGDEITANVNGTVTAISVSAGDTVTKDMVLCTIEVPDMGHTLSFSVTNEQAQRLRVGDTATVSNYYWGKEIVATLSSIVTDPKNPQTNKTLTFDLTGDVTSGSELTISVGQKSANYDTIVPNSSIRSDSNGQFVLAVESKSSPLGNRYVAKRVSVEVLAADDDNSAVVADLGWGDYVITTSSSPVKAGDQVRLTDS